MVYVDGKKYACETCIKGHRSSSCKHTDRPLFEIKKKGRPVTQCEHCRELRKTRQIHVKCVCEGKETAEAATPSSSQVLAKVSARAAFPSGLPEELLEASVASQPFSEGSDSDQSNPVCNCKDSVTCTCWTPRNRAKRPARPDRRSFGAASAVSVGEPISQPAALVIYAHAGNNRPVLPKPPPADRPASPSRTSHSPSVSQSGRLPTHGQSLYSPYGRAYELSHAPGYSTSPASLQNILNDAPSPNSPFGSWPLGSGNSYPTSPVPTSTCGCGPACACPGCIEHQGTNADPSATCANPSTCLACLDCNLNTLTALASDATRTIYDPTQMQNIDEWLRQVSSMPDLPSSSMQSPYPSSSSQSQPDLRYDPSMMQPYGMWDDVPNPQLPPRFAPTVPRDCCSGQCQCPSGLCACPPDCCGCCQGCQCTNCVHEGGSGRPLTFATSGERVPCCGGRDDRGALSMPGGSIAGPSTSARTSYDGSAASAPYPEGSWLTVPRQPLSRASSSSSKSSAQPSTSSSSPMGYEMNDSRSSAADTNVGSCCQSMGNLTTNVSQAGSSSHRRGSDHNEYRTSSSKFASRPF